MIKFGFQHPSFTYDGQGQEIFLALRTRAKLAEELGFDSFWVMDHFFQIPRVGGIEEPMMEGWSTISALSDATEKIRLGTLVSGNIYRNPALLAKMGATVDIISNGRLNMGIGAGWFETEAKAYSIPYYNVGERLKRLDEALQIIRGMWSSKKFSFKGEYYQIEDALCEPKPVQKPYPPIWIGGSGEKVTLKLVARYGNACNLFGEPEAIKRKLGVLAAHCKTVGRNYNEIQKTRLGHIVVGKTESEVKVMLAKERHPGMSDEEYAAYAIYGTPDEVADKIQDLVDAGLDYLIFNVHFPNEEKILRLFAEKVIPQF